MPSPPFFEVAVARVAQEGGSSASTQGCCGGRLTWEGPERASPAPAGLRSTCGPEVGVDIEGFAQSRVAHSPNFAQEGPWGALAEATVS